MTRRLQCPAVLGPWEAYAARFDDLTDSFAQRRGVREYMAAGGAGPECGAGPE
jgi:hypothetical protein